MAGGYEDALKIPELRKRIFFTIGMLLIYRLGVFVPTPGINTERLRALFDQASSTVFGIVNMFSGGALENFSVLALGIMPYISVSIIIQLLTTTFKPLEELSKEGEQGRRVIVKYTRWFTIILALVQGCAISIGLEHQGVVADPGYAFRIKTAITLTTGTAFLMWLGEQISERGIGNGISLLIMAGIVARMPATLYHTVSMISTGEITPFGVLGILAFGVGVIAFIVYVERSQRRIPVQYPRRAVGRQVTQAMTQHLPFKVNSAGVMPAIFANAVFSLPATIAQFGTGGWLHDSMNWLYSHTWIYESIFLAMIIFFSYFFTAIQIDPPKVAENLKKNGGFIPTVRPGKDTADFLSAVLSRLTLWGSLYLGIVCILPTLFYRSMNAGAYTAIFGGTAVLIAVGVTLDTAAQIQSHIVARNYEGFMKKGPAKVRGMSRASQVKGRLIRR